MPTNHRFICRTCTSVFFCLLIPSIARYKTAIKRNCIHGANPSFFYPEYFPRTGTKTNAAASRWAYSQTPEYFPRKGTKTNCCPLNVF